MTTRVVRAFLPTLRKVERQLSVPIPARVRILRELEFDLEELRRQLEAEGLPAEDARARSLDALVPDRGTLRELGRLYTPLYRRLTGHLAGDRVQLLERSALAIATISVLLAETLVLLRADLFSDPSPFLWPVLGLGAVSFAMVLREAFALWVKGDHRPAHGSRAILAAAAVTLATGVFGALVDAYGWVGTLEVAPSLLRSPMRELVVREAALLSVSMVLALAGGLAWFVLTQWLTLVSSARREVLGLDPTETPQ